VAGAIKNGKDRTWKVRLLPTVQQTHSVLFQILSEPKLEQFKNNERYFLPNSFIIKFPYILDEV
jgi:hypothetical protein